MKQVEKDPRTWRSRNCEIPKKGVRVNCLNTINDNCESEDASQLDFLCELSNELPTNCSSVLSKRRIVRAYNCVIVYSLQARREFI